MDHWKRQCHSDMGIPAFWASPVTLMLTQIAKVIWEGDANVTRVLGMGIPKPALQAFEKEGRRGFGRERIGASLHPRAPLEFLSRLKLRFPFPFKRLPHRLTINFIVHTMCRYRKRRPRPCNSWKWRDWSITSPLCEWCWGFSLCNSKTKTSCHTWFNYGWFHAICVCFFLMKWTNMASLCRLLVWSIGLPSMSLLLIY